MATYTSNYAWTKPSGNDNVDISVLNANLDSQDSIIHDAFMNMAQAFSELSTYEVGDIVVYGTTTYKCHTAVTTAGSWTGSTNWQVYKLSEGGGGGLTLGETSSTAYRGDRGKTAYDHSQTTGNPHGTTASDVGLGNVPNVSTNNQTPTFTEASTRNNIASGDKLSVIMGKIAKFFNDLKTVAFSGSYNDLTNKPSIPTKTSDITNDSNFVSDANYVHTDNNFTTSEKTKLAGIASGAEANVQANWSQTNTSADDFIKNKPSLATVATSGSYADLSNKPTIPTTAGGISYDNTDSGLSATDVQGVVDEVVARIGDSTNLPKNAGIRYYTLPYAASLNSKSQIQTYLQYANISKGIEVVTFTLTNQPNTTSGMMVTQFAQSHPSNSSQGNGVGVFIGYYYTNSPIYFKCINGIYTLYDMSQDNRLKSNEKEFTNITLNANKEANLGNIYTQMLPSGVNGTIMLIEICSAATGAGTLRIECGTYSSGSNMWLIGNVANQSIANVRLRALYYEN